LMHGSNKCNRKGTRSGKTRCALPFHIRGATQRPGNSQREVERTERQNKIRFVLLTGSNEKDNIIQKSKVLKGAKGKGYTAEEASLL